MPSVHGDAYVVVQVNSARTDHYYPEPSSWHKAEPDHELPLYEDSEVSPAVLLPTEASFKHSTYELVGHRLQVHGESLRG